MDYLLVAEDLWWWKKATWKVSKLQKARAGSYAHLKFISTMHQARCQEISWSPVSRDTNFEQDICIPAIYVKIFDPLLEPVNTNKQTNKHKLYYVIWLRRWTITGGTFHQFSREHFTQLSSMFEKSPFLSKAKALSWNLMEYQTFS